MADKFALFRYHPAPLETGAVETSEKRCVCCGKARGFIYTGPVYSEHELDDSLCPWCIADGSAAEKYDAVFSDDTTLYEAGLDEEIVVEVTRRNPGFTSWQSEKWASHCGDACEFHGDATVSDIKEMGAAAREELSSELGLDASEWEAFIKNYCPPGDPAVYKFICRRCGTVIYNGDCS